MTTMVDSAEVPEELPPPPVERKVTDGYIHTDQEQWTKHGYDDCLLDIYQFLTDNPACLHWEATKFHNISALVNQIREKQNLTVPVV